MRDKASTADMRTFPGDWSIPVPIKEVDGMGIMCISGRVGVTLDGHLILDRTQPLLIKYLYKNLQTYWYKPYVIFHAIYVNQGFVNILDKVFE